MDCILPEINVYSNKEFIVKNIIIKDDKIVGFVDKINDDEKILYELKGCFLFPGFIDVHVHLREPGFLYKETIESGSFAGAAGGYTTICSMPNLNPTPDTLEHLNVQLKCIEKDAMINVIPYGTITMGQKGEEIAQLEKMKDYVIGFSDDGRGVQNDQMMEEAMIMAKALNKIIVAHCEDNTLLNSGYIHDGEYAKKHNHLGICSASEYEQVRRDLELVRKTRCAYHVCHISTKETVDLIRKAKKEGLDVSCETAPHYLVLNDSMLEESGNFKMNPPIRDVSDQQALIQGILDGTIDMIATDHAPHSLEEKSKGLKGSLMGVVGLETAFSILYSELVLSGIITLSKLIELLSINSRNRFKIKTGDDYCLWDLNKKYTIDSDKFLSKGRSTPFNNRLVHGKHIYTFYQGKIVDLGNRG
ncbi:MAG: dihydroorotase [Erysipelotrichaceae bacterium]